jgi:hypothetical protein
MVLYTRRITKDFLDLLINLGHKMAGIWARNTMVLHYSFNKITIALPYEAILYWKAD